MKCLLNFRALNFLYERVTYLNTTNETKILAPKNFYLAIEILLDWRSQAMAGVYPTTTLDDRFFQSLKVNHRHNYPKTYGRHKKDLPRDESKPYTEVDPIHWTEIL